MQPNDIELLLHILASFSRSAFVFNSSSDQMENTHTHFPCQTLEPKSDSWQLPLGPHHAHVLGSIEGQCFGTRTWRRKFRAGRWMQMPGATVSPEASLSISWVSGQHLVCQTLWMEEKAVCFWPKQSFLNKLNLNLWMDMFRIPWCSLGTQWTKVQSVSFTWAAL